MKRIVLSLAALVTLGASAMAETDGAFILNEFPHCKGVPVFSPYSAGATGAVEAKQRADWWAKLKPIAGAPCVLQADYGNITFCSKLVCRNIEIK